MARLCVHLPAQQNLKSRPGLTRYYEAGYQLGLLSPALSNDMTRGKNWLIKSLIEKTVSLPFSL